MSDNNCEETCEPDLICDPCSDGLNQYESDIYTTLIHWLESVTCIPWIQPNQEASEISGYHTDLQYGTLYIQTIDDQEVVESHVVAIGEIERCTQIDIKATMSVNLSVYNYSTGCVTKSPSDILSQMYMVHKFNKEIQDRFCSLGIATTEWGVISNIIETEGTSQKYRAQRELDFQITRQSSVRERLVEDVSLNVDCCN
ncbi:hypothetical protein N9043_01120 [bacterium]|nr:hypothetical protein [bacterium]